ncbi:nuclear transport factor 2 family protein [Streptomyces sp. NPDC005728]|uniref:nuclear transport factor 2 family protein n=1 Tax=Streptomyces sp. NPDC005728 TaxID=3157054 RepID=UPI0033D5FF15
MSDWIDSFYADVDAQLTERVLDRFTPDGELVFGSNPPAIGHPAMREVLENLRAALSGMRHEWCNRWTVDEKTLVLETRVHYTTRGGTEVILPSVSVIDRDASGLITSLRIHIDAAPLFGALDAESVTAQPEPAASHEAAGRPAGARVERRPDPVERGGIHCPNK